VITELTERVIEAMHGDLEPGWVVWVRCRETRVALPIVADVVSNRSSCVWDPNAESAAGSEDAKALSEYVLDLAGVFEVLEKVFAVHDEHSAIGERKWFA
jgi:hypothetical protein